MGLAERFSPTSTILYRYVFRHVVATNLKIGLKPEQLPLFVQDTEVSEFDVNWLRDRRNSPSDPSRGDFENVDVSLAAKAIGSSANFIRVYLQNSTYHPIGRRLVFARSTRFGIQTVYGHSLSTDIPLPERFFAGGGTSLRGFGLNQAGPRDPVTGFPVGGQAELIFNQDLRFPMHLASHRRSAGRRHFLRCRECVFQHSANLASYRAAGAHVRSKQSEYVFDELHEQYELFFAHGGI